MRIIFTCHLWAAEAALREWKTSYPGMEWLGWLQEGVGLVDISGSLAHAAEECRKRPIVFTRHICPANLTASPDEGVGMLLPPILSRLDDSLSYSVQARSYDGNAPTRLVSDALCNAGMRLDVRNPEQVVSVYRAKDAIYAGVSSSRDNLSAWNGGMMHFKAEGAISRAEFKLLEALRILAPDFSGMKAAFDITGVKAALDLGAAPGGWTRVLAGDLGISVTAVDPAELDTRALELPDVSHHRITAREFLRENPDARFDLIVNDMKMDARLSLGLMDELSPLLREGGIFIATLKLPGETRAMAEAAGIPGRKKTRSKSV